jgi:hypothetical protein
MNKNWLKILVAISAILIAGSAAYFSVTGLGVLFSGAAIAVMVMAGSLEFAKLVTATYLKQEWDNVSGINKWYLTSAVVILMAITSAGIFGYLSNAFQQQNLKLEQVQREVDVWNNKIKLTNDQIITLQGQQKDLSTTQNTLITKGNVNNRLIRSADNRDRQSNKISNRINSLQDSIVVYNGKINDIKNANIGIEREVGGFRFVAEAFGVELKSVVKFFIILIVIVFDPLAVALVISFNQLVTVPKRKDEDEATDPSDLKDFVDESTRLRLSDDDLKKLEDVLLNPPFPNGALKEAAKRYSDEVREKHTHINDFDTQENKPWNGISQEVWDRMEAIEKQREAIHGPITEEDLPPNGAYANSGIRERLEQEIDEEPYAGLNTPYVSDDFTIGPDGAFEVTEEIQKQLQDDNISDWDSTLMDGLEDEEPFFTEEEMEKIFQEEPTTEEESENFSTIEAIPTNIFQQEDGWTEELEQQYWVEQENAIEEPATFNEQSIQEEVEEMISQALSVPPIEDTVIHVEMPNDDSEIESEKKKS